MNNRSTILAILALACVPLAACDEQSEAVAQKPLDLTKDPLLARALHDPLMVDPDLAGSNEANAVIAYRDGHPLPPFTATKIARERAEEAAQMELLDGGQAFDLPAFSADADGADLADVSNAGEIVEKLGSRTDCIERLSNNLEWSTAMPETSSIIPHGMIQMAAGVDEGTCVIRVLRYITPAAPSNVLHYHFVKADRARFRIEVFEQPELRMRAERRDQTIAVHVREGHDGMSLVDVVHWRK